MFLSHEKVQEYLKRIDYNGTLTANKNTLIELHQQHVFHVPFENIDIIQGKSISLNLEKIYEKIVTNCRGGYCFELNKLFTKLLQTIGYKVTNLAARVLNDNRNLSRPKTHQLLMVSIEDDNFICDVGFGGHGLLKPLLLKNNHSEKQFEETFRIVTCEKLNYILQVRVNNSWFDSYAFDLNDYCFIDYELANFYCNHSPESPFTQKLICTKPTTSGRITLVDNLFKKKSKSEIVESILSTKEIVSTCLLNKFGVNVKLNNVPGIIGIVS